MYVAGLAAHLQQTCSAAGFVMPRGEHPCVQEEVRMHVITCADDQVVMDGAMASSLNYWWTLANLAGQVI
jgi:hypothetical protein